MPIILLLLAFVLKQVIDRSSSLSDLIDGLLEFPVEIIFLATSLIVGYIISPLGNDRKGIVWFILYIIASVFIIILWRRAKKCFDAKATWNAFWLSGGSYFLAVSALVFAIILITQSNESH